MPSEPRPPLGNTQALPFLYHVAAVVLFAAISGALFHPWLRPYHLPQRGGPGQPFRAGDLTPLFYVWNTVIHRAIHQGELPWWTDHIYCGEPFLAKAQVGVFSLTTALLLVLPPELVSTWTFLLHLTIAATATYAGTLLLLKHTDAELPAAARWIAALSGGAFFETSAILVEHTIQGHGPIVVAACWTPLILSVGVRSLLVPRPPQRLAVAAGVLIALQFLAGGATATLYSGLGLAITALLNTTVAFGRRRWLTGFRQLVWLAVTATTATSAAAIKLLPALALMPVSNRAGGLDPWTAAAPIIEFTPPAIAALLDPTGTAFSGCWLLVPLGLTLVGLLNQHPRRVVIALLAIAVTGVVVAVRPEAFVVLWYTFPGFRYQRIPQRALMLFYAAVALGMAFGMARVLKRLGLPQPRLARLTTMALLATSMAIAENLAWRSELPPTRDIRLEQQANAIFRYLARQANGFRVHVWESRDRNWGLEHIATPLGVPTMVGWDHMWLLDYLGAEGRVGKDVPPFVAVSYRASHPERFWALANVRWVTRSVGSTLMRESRAGSRSRALPLRLVARFPESPYAQPSWSDGPYLWENPFAMPRAWFADRAIAIIGSRAARRWATYRLIDELPFVPRRVALLELNSSESELIDQLPGVLAVVAVSGAHQAPRRHRWIRWDPYREPVPRKLVAAVRAAQDSPLSGVTVRYERLTNSRRRITLNRRQHGYVVLSEKFAHFPGWSAEDVRGVRRPLLRAFGVFTALPTTDAVTTLTLRYSPPGRMLGFWLSGCIWVACLVMVVTWVWRKTTARH